MRTRRRKTKITAAVTTERALLNICVKPALAQFALALEDFHFSCAVTSGALSFGLDQAT